MNLWDGHFSDPFRSHIHVDLDQLAKVMPSAQKDLEAIRKRQIDAHVTKRFLDAIVLLLGEGNERRGRRVLVDYLTNMLLPR